MSEKEFVTMEECERKHKATVRQVGVLFTCIALIMIGVGWAVNAAYASSERAAAVEHQLNVHKEVQAERNKNTKETLERIELETKSMRKMVEDLWLRQHSIGADSP